MNVSIRRFAELDGCSEGLVRRGIREGKLKAEPDGRLDPALAKSSWRRSNAIANHDAHKTRTHVRDGETLEQAAERIVNESTTVPAVGVSIAKRTACEAILKQLEVDQKTGVVVAVADVRDIVGSQLATVRTRLLAIPSEHAPRLTRIKTPAEMQDALTGLIVEALSELVGYATERKHA